MAAIAWSLRFFLWINLGCLLLVSTDTIRQAGEMSILAMFGIVNGSALPLWLALAGKKRRARNLCNILFLRGFRQEVRAEVPNRVLPCIGCYGRLMWLRNAVRVVDQDRIGLLTGETMTDAETQPASREEWQAQVQELLARADLAVIDFSVLSDSLMWEIEQCLERMPAQRMILITELSRHASENYRSLSTRFPELWHTPEPIPVYPSRFVIPLRFWRWWFFQYERRMHGCMQSIAEQSPASRLTSHVPEAGASHRPTDAEPGQ